MRRRPLPWLLALPLIVAGSVGAHALSALLATAPATEHVGEVAERSSTGTAGYLVVLLGAFGAVAALGTASSTLSLLRRRERRGVSPSLFFWLPPAAYTLQELTERVLHAEAAPFQAVHDPRFLLGLAFQIPFGLAALGIARLLYRVGRRLVAALRRTRRTSALRRPVTLARAPIETVLARIAVRALGYTQRGPPAASRA